MNRFLLLLLLVCTGAIAQSTSLTCGNQTVILTCSGVSISTPTSAPIPIVSPPSLPTVIIGPAPTSLECQAPGGWECAINPFTIPNPPSGTVPSARLDIISGRTFVFTAGANVVHSFPIMFDSAHFGGYSGASIGVAEVAFNRTPRDVVLSDLPGSMNPMDFSHFGCRLLNFQEAATIVVSFDTAVPGACNVQRDRQYWLNVKATTAGVVNSYLLQPFPQ